MKDLVNIAKSDIEFLGRTNHLAPISIEGVASAANLTEGGSAEVCIYKIVGQEKMLKINEELCSALRLVFDSIKQEHQDLLNQYVANPNHNSIKDEATEILMELYNVDTISIVCHDRVKKYLDANPGVEYDDEDDQYGWIPENAEYNINV